MKLTTSFSLVCLLLLFFCTNLSLAKSRGRSSSSRGRTSLSNRGHNSNRGGHRNTGGSHQQYPGQGYERGYESPPGVYINHNPNNKILSPRFREGFRGNSVGRGSSFSNSVKHMGYFPNERSRGFGRRAMIAAGGGAMMGIALGYGLARFRRPNFHNPQEEYYYNHYMYRKYDTNSPDTHSRDDGLSQPPGAYRRFMDNCINRKDLFPNIKPAAKTAASLKTTTTTFATASLYNDTHDQSTQNNITEEETSSTSAPSAPNSLFKPEAHLEAQLFNETPDDQDTVTILEIGHPALMSQLKIRTCVEMFIETQLTSGAQGLEIGGRGLLVMILSTVVMLLNSNMLTLLH